MASRTHIVYFGTILQPTSVASKALTITIHQEAALGVDANGYISFFEERAAECAHEQAIKDCRQHCYLSASQFLMPGMVDCHFHAPQIQFSGTALDLPLMKWLNIYTFPAEARMQDLNLASQVYTSAVQCSLSQGSTTVCYFATKDLAPTKLLADICHKFGQRAFVGMVGMDKLTRPLSSDVTERCLQDTEELIKYIGTQPAQLVRPVMTPRRRLLMGFGKLAAKYGVHIQSHVSESADEIAHVETLASEYGGLSRDTAIFADCGLLTNKTVLAHGVHLNPTELALLQREGSSIAHCPLSNSFFADAAFPLSNALEMDLKIGLGTDVAGGYSPCMLDAIRATTITAQMLRKGVDQYRHATEPQPQSEGKQVHTRDEVTWKTALWLATMGGAQALGIDSTAGSFLPGKAFDAVLFDARGSQADKTGHVGKVRWFPQLDTVEDLVQKCIHLGDDRHIQQVFVQGRPVKA